MSWPIKKPGCANNQADLVTTFSPDIKPQRCAKFKQCNAPICPLDESWRKHKHLDGERICFWLVEASKRGGRLPATPALAPLQAKAVSVAYAEINARYGPIRRRLRRTMLTPSRLHSVAA